MSSETKMQNINTKDIVVNELMQRDVERRKAQFNKIMRTFNPDLVNPVKVALIDGKYYCFDGQMTMKVLKARNRGKDLCVPCKVFYGLTEMDAAMLFVDQVGTAVKVSAADKLRVLKNYGDEEAVALVKLVENNGLQISWNGSKGKNAITAISTLQSVFRDLDGLKTPEKFAEFIRVLKEAYDGNSDAHVAAMLSGVGLFIKTYFGQYDHDRLVRKLREHNPNDLIRDARVDRSSGTRKYAVMILNYYNGSLRNPLPNNL